MSNRLWLKAMLAEMSGERLLNALRRRLTNWPHTLAWYWQMTSKAALYHQLSSLHNKFPNQRCFIIGNGPSLQKMDLSPLANEITFGLNRIYLMFDKLGFATTFHVTINELVIEQCVTDIQHVPTTRFVNWNRRKLFNEEESLLFLHQTYTPHFSKNLLKPIWGGATVTYAAMQIAYYMGFRQVILIGVDHQFVAKGTPHETVISKGEDPDHFDPGYFGKGFRWQLPDLSTSEFAYKMAKEVFEKDGREILDATVGGNLNVYEKVAFESLFA